MIAINIKWDIDYDDNGMLPTEIEIPKEIENDEDKISDYLSDYTGYCHEGFELFDECIFDAVLDNGRNIDMTKVCGCENTETLDDCENKCRRYYDCHNVTLANDILKLYEDLKKNKLKGENKYENY